MRARDFDSGEFQAIAWFLNQQLHALGYHFMVIHEDGQEPRWVVVGDGTELATSTVSDDALFTIFQRLLREAREFHAELD